MACNCRICQRHDEYERHMDNLTRIKNDLILQEVGGVEEAIEFFQQVYNDLNNIEMDNDVNRSIIEGSWPTADENIKYARARYQRKIREQKNG